jgi:hypothetical protein
MSLFVCLDLYSQLWEAIHLVHRGQYAITQDICNLFSVYYAQLIL